MTYNPYFYSVTQLHTLCNGFAPLPSTLIKATGLFCARARMIVNHFPIYYSPLFSNEEFIRSFVR